MPALIWFISIRPSIPTPITTSSDTNFIEFDQTEAKKRRAKMMIPVNSRSIREVGYDGYYLYVRFHTSDTLYTHPGVPNSVFVGLMTADSKGKFYNQRVRGRYK
jgi:hypothetical protein